MSKIGKQPVILPEGVKAEISGREVVINGPKGTLKRTIPKGIEISQKDNSLILEVKSEELNSIYGTTRVLIANMVKGVYEGWSKQLELVGTGYRAEVQGTTLVLTIGFSHPVKIEAPEGISFKVEKTIITVEGADKETVGQIAANIREVRPPEPYKGKGIKYIDEVIRRKAGKVTKAVGAPG
jgi:large subunit ribosomal protein L6